MKLSDFEAVSPEDFVVFEDGMPYSYVIDRWYKTGAKEVDDFPKFYTAEQMQEYAKAKVKELLFEQLWNDRFYANSKIFFDKEVEKICSTIFEEDTKND
ncbi:hypothetical protein [Lactococcus lactis]|uniref:hypothetical protein n=1 Tax=Lactococcus lactis TaxID=1358 RepID=UPI00071547EF|nr:hypothetical protein [Lactococcus lactis]KRO22322.1 hypothetical protein IV65_GL000741 [Lactococcus lactis subsp. lactis]